MKLSPVMMFCGALWVFTLTFGGSLGVAILLYVRHDVPGSEMKSLFLGFLIVVLAALGSYLKGKAELPEWAEELLKQAKMGTTIATIAPPPLYSSETNSVTVSASSTTAIADVTPLPSVASVMAMSVAPPSPSIPPTPPVSSESKS